MRIASRSKVSDSAPRVEAEDAEADRRVEERKKREAALVGRVDAPLLSRSACCFRSFCPSTQPKSSRSKQWNATVSRLAICRRICLIMRLTDIRAVHLTREWNRLLESGGHHRKTRTARPLSAKTVQNIAGVVSKARSRAINGVLITVNPVRDSERPSKARKKGIALNSAQQRLAIESSTGCWCMPIFLELSAATGARRGEVLAIRWADIHGDEVVIARSLSQTRTGLEFKGTKTGEERRITLPESAISALAAHRKAQAVFRHQFGPDYRADLDLVFANPDGSPLRP